MPDETVTPATTDSGAMPPAPKPSNDVRSFVEKLWTETANVPDHDHAVRASRECQKTLFPAWFDRSDRYRGMAPLELRTRTDDRRVRVNLTYKNVLQTVALTVPDEHSFNWDAVPMVGADQGLADQATKKLADTLVPVVRQYCDEAGWQEVVQGWVQDACQYRLAIMKVVFDRDYVKDSVKIHAEGRDEQQIVERLRVLVEDYKRKVFSDSDARMQEIKALQETLGIEGDILKLWSGLRVELVPIDCFRFDPSIRGYEQVYQAAWMSHDVMMSAEEIREKYPFQMNEDGTWSGVHPDDIAIACKGERSQMRSSNDTFYGNAREKGKGPTPTPDSVAETNRMIVREVWLRKLGKVVVLIDGLQYPAAEWTPVKTPSQWYPFRLLRLNRITGQVYGYSDVELQMEIQHRINRKRSDEERGRWLSLPRGYYNTQGIDQTEVNKMRDHNPGEWKGINLGGAKSIKEAMEFMQFQFDPQWFDTTKDETEMRMMASLPQQMMGTTGQAKYSSEVEAAMQGAAIAAAARGTIVRRALEGAYDLIAEILLQELDPEEALEIAGPNGFWPIVYSDTEGKNLYDQIHQQAGQQVDQQIQAMGMQASASGISFQAPPVDVLESAKAEEVKKLCLRQFGWEEPVTRETIFRRLKCRVTVAMNTVADRQQRVEAFQTVSASFQMGAQAAASISQTSAAIGQVCIFNPKPMLSHVKSMFNGDESIKEMFQMVPMAPSPMPIGGQQGQSAPGLPPEIAGKTQQQTVGQAGAPANSPNSAVTPVGDRGGVNKTT